MVELATKNDQTQLLMNGISGRRDPEKQVSDVSIQTDTCDTLVCHKEHVNRIHYRCSPELASFAI